MFHSYGAVYQRVSEGFLKWGILKYHGFQYSIFFPYCILKRHTLRQGKLNQYYNIYIIYIFCFDMGILHLGNLHMVKFVLWCESFVVSERIQRR